MARCYFGPVCMLLYRLIFIAKNAPDLFGSLIATGIFAHNRITGYFEHCCRDGTSSDNGYYVAFYQLRRNCNRIFDGGNGNCAWNFTENKIRIEKASFLMRCVIYLYVVLKTTYNSKRKIYFDVSGKKC